jgi:four helix bundle protein
MTNYNGLRVWKEAHALTLEIYRQTTRFPRHEQYGLTDQLRRAAVSVGANLAEGCGRGGNRELARFITIAIGSANEMEYLLLLAHDLGYLETNDLGRSANMIARMANNLRKIVLKDIDNRGTKSTTVRSTRSSLDPRRKKPTDE